MSKTVLADVEGFTPVIDCVARDVGLTGAAVFGRIWRFCQLEDGVCRASLEKISEGLGIDRATVMRHAQQLCIKGYLKDLTPDLRNHPHTYADTGKASLRVSISVAQRNTSTPTVAERNVTVAQGNTSVAESQLKKVLKKDSEETEDLALKPNQNQEHPAYKALAEAASFVWPTRTEQWQHKVRPLLLGADLSMDENEIVVAGLGRDAAMAQDRYAATLERALVGVLGKPIKLTFRE